MGVTPSTAQAHECHQTHAQTTTSASTRRVDPTELEPQIKNRTLKQKSEVNPEKKSEPAEEVGTRREHQSSLYTKQDHQRAAISKPT